MENQHQAVAQQGDHSSEENRIERVIETHIKELLAKQITGSVRWRETMLYLESKGIKEIIEIGSGKVLAGLVGRTCKDMTSKSIQSLADIKLFVE